MVIYVVYNCILNDTHLFGFLELWFNIPLNKQLFIHVEMERILEPPHGKTNNLHMRKQRHRSASR